MLGNRYENQDCSIARALEVVGERWSLLIVRDALFGVRRFSDFVEHLEIPKGVLSARLRALVDAGVLERRADPDHAGRAVYELTSRGRELWPVVHSLAHWGGGLIDAGSPRRRYHHAGCDAELDARGACLRCGAVPPPQDVATTWTKGRRPTRRDDRVSRVLREPRRLLHPIA
jgi:DNA-binding HxlR family transcriptional regulator